MEKYISELLKIRYKVKENAPLIHCITNPISINDCANAVLALGAKPIMAEHPLETADITAGAAALCVNLGNITDVRLEGITAAARSANKNNVPIIIDAVGVTCSRLRKDFCKGFINQYKPEIIKGNAAEIKALAGEKFAAKGIDSNEKDVNSVLEAAKALAIKSSCVVLSSGKTDIVTDGKKSALISNGCEMMSQLTGTGCMLGAVTAAFLSCADAFDSAVLGCGFFGICGELSQFAKGTGSFRIMLMDSIYATDNETVADRLKIEII
ncbi:MULTISPECIES: hydroxyethylthiazole kinase [unclassified Ruminococcus]|uniref:hydroxyethylthiazole kinase n=1 Tax=unclassified Ruminococcus TaxID=2608920 RepID=UPI00210902AE